MFTTNVMAIPTMIFDHSDAFPPKVIMIINNQATAKKLDMQSFVIKAKNDQLSAIYSTRGCFSVGMQVQRAVFTRQLVPIAQILCVCVCVCVCVLLGVGREVKKHLVLLKVN